MEIELLSQMTRTEQFETGYDSCRGALQEILMKYEELLKNNELVDLARFYYYKRDGADWHPVCQDCTSYHYNGLDQCYYCKKDFKFKKNAKGTEKHEEMRD